MCRTGQMILAQTLIYHLLGRGVLSKAYIYLSFVMGLIYHSDWRLGTQDVRQPYSIYRQVILNLIWCEGHSISFLLLDFALFLRHPVDHVSIFVA